MTLVTEARPPIYQALRGLAHAPLVPSLVAVIGGLLVGAIVLVWAGADPLAAYVSIVTGSLGSSFGRSQLLVQLVPLLIIALGLAVAFRAAVWNVGAEGQFYLGALGGGAAAIHVAPALGPVGIPFALVCGTAAGAVWGALVGVMRVKRGASEIIASLLLNYVAIFFYAYMIRQPLRDPDGYYPVSRIVPAEFRLAPLPGVDVHAGLAIALLLVPLVYYLLRHTPFGLDLRAMGEGREAAQASGIGVSGHIVRVLAISGGAAGLAGVVQILGVQFILQSGISPGYGFTAIVVALIGRNAPVGILIAAVLISMLEIGGTALQVTQGVPVAVVSTIAALFIIFLVAAQGLRN